MRHPSLTLGAVGLTVGAALALAGTASAHPNLAFKPAVTCFDDATVTATGVEGGNVTATSRLELTGNGVQTEQIVLTPNDNGVAKDVGSVPDNFVGHYFLSVTIEGKTNTVQGDLDCRPSLPPPANFVPPPPPPTTPPPTCADLMRQYPKAGPKRVRSWRCVPRKPPPPPRRREVCAAPAKLRIVQQQRGTLFTETYPLRVIIGARANYPQGGALQVWDEGLQNFVGPDGNRVERLVIPVRPLAKGQRLNVDRTMGYVGVEAFRVVIRTFAKFTVNGKPCGHTFDDHYEG